MNYILNLALLSVQADADESHLIKQVVFVNVVFVESESHSCTSKGDWDVFQLSHFEIRLLVIPHREMSQSRELGVFVSLVVHFYPTRDLGMMS